MNKALQAWAKENNYFGSQVVFVRDRLAPLVGSGLAFEEVVALPYVIGEHVSGEVRLPVYQMGRADLGLRIVLRDNFNDWKMSVLSDHPIVSHALPLLFEDRSLSAVYFEGFPRELVFAAYSDRNNRKFSASLDSAYALWAAVFEIMRILGALHAS